MNGATVDINVKVGNSTMEFKNVPSNYSVTSYNNAIITETKELMSIICYRAVEVLWIVFLIIIT